MHIYLPKSNNAYFLSENQQFVLKTLDCVLQVLVLDIFMTASREELDRNFRLDSDCRLMSVGTAAAAASVSLGLQLFPSPLLLIYAYFSTEKNLLIWRKSKKGFARPIMRCEARAMGWHFSLFCNFWRPRSKQSGAELYCDCQCIRV